MKRGYTALEYKSIIRRLKAARPGIAIATDIIVGFPGETEDDFERTMDLIEDVGFDASFSFVCRSALMRMLRKSAAACSVKSSVCSFSGLPGAAKAN